jgi:predicted XRE-type DNA-binding protein
MDNSEEKLVQKAKRAKKSPALASSKPLAPRIKADEGNDTMTKSRTARTKRADTDAMRKKFIADAYFRKRQTQEEIGRQLGISKARVSQIVREILNEARDRKLIPAREYIKAEMEEIEQIRRGYWAAWEQEKIAANAEEIIEVAELTIDDTDAIGDDNDILKARTGSMSTRKISRRKRKRSFNTKSLDGLRACSEYNIRLLEILHGKEMGHMPNANDAQLDYLGELDPKEQMEEAMSRTFMVFESLSESGVQFSHLDALSPKEKKTALAELLIESYRVAGEKARKKKPD